MTFTHGAIPDDATNGPSDRMTVPLFPLPSVVLFPRAVLPLHVFEERYKAMIRDALAGPRRVAMALLRPGWEKGYYSRPAIEPVICVGTILAHERLADGRYNLLLQGTDRAAVVRELPDDETGTPYRIAIAKALPDEVDEDAAAGRPALGEALEASTWASTPLGRKFVDLIASPVPMAELVDLMAFNFVEDVAAKQRLLAERSVGRRVDLLTHALMAMAARPASPGNRYARPSLN